MPRRPAKSQLAKSKSRRQRHKNTKQRVRTVDSSPSVVRATSATSAEGTTERGSDAVAVVTHEGEEGFCDLGVIFNTQSLIPQRTQSPPLPLLLMSPSPPKKRKVDTVCETPGSILTRKHLRSHHTPSSAKRRQKLSWRKAYRKRCSTAEKEKKSAAARAVYGGLTPRTKELLLAKRRSAALNRYRSLTYDIKDRTIQKIQVLKSRRSLQLKVGADEERSPGGREAFMETKRMADKIRYDERTPLSKKRYLEEKRAAYQGLSPGSKESLLDAQRAREKQLTPRSRSSRLQKMKRLSHEWWKNLTPTTKQKETQKRGRRMKQLYKKMSDAQKRQYVAVQALRMSRRYRNMTEEEKKAYKKRARDKVMAQYYYSDEKRLSVKKAVQARRFRMRQMMIAQFKSTNTSMLKLCEQRWLHSVISRLASSWSLTADVLSRRAGRLALYRKVKQRVSEVLVLRARCVKTLLQKVKALETYLIQECSVAEIAASEGEAEEIIKRALGRKRYHVRSWDIKKDQQACDYYNYHKDINFPDDTEGVLADFATPLPKDVAEIMEEDDVEVLLEDASVSEENPLSGIMPVESDDEFEGFSEADLHTTEAIKTMYSEHMTERDVDQELGEANTTAKQMGVTPARPCTDQCLLPANWARRIYTLLRELRSRLNVPQILQTLLNIEACSQCTSVGTVCTESCGGSDLGSCTDVLNLLRSVSPHYAGMRTLQVRYYSIRQDAEWILECDQVVNSGDYWAFWGFIRKRCPKLISREEGDAERRRAKTGEMRGRPIEAEVEEKYGHLQHIFLAKLNDFPTESCCLCERWTENSKLTSMKKDARLGEKGKAVWRRMASELELKYADGNASWPKKVCDNCLEQVKNGRLPRYSFVNGMEYVEPPSCIKNLNEVERILIQRAKYMLTLIKLMPYSKRVAVNAATKGMRGFGFYMPLPDDDVKMSLNESVLPSLRDYEILVDCHPTKKSIIWQYPVRSEEVLKALRFLQRENELYRNISIDEAFAERLGDHFNVIPSTDTSTELQKENPIVASGIAETLSQREPVSPTGICGPAAEVRTVTTGISAACREPIGGTYGEPEAISPTGICEAAAEVQTISPTGISGAYGEPEAVNPAGITHTSTQREARRTARQVMEQFDLLKYVPNGQSLPGFSVKRIQADYPNKADTDLFRMSHLMGPPAYEDEKIEEKCFPDLYITGKFGYTYPREVALRRGDYIRARILHKSGAWRRKISYLFHARQWKDINNLKSGVYAMLNISKTGQLTAGNFLRQIEEGNRQLDTGLNMLMSKLPNSAAFLNQKRTDLMAMDEVLGPATVFITLSCAEYYWKDMEKFLRKVNSDLEGAITMPIGQLAALDPAAVCMQFRKRFEAIQKVIMDAEGPLGEVTDYVWRVEYQARGAPHLHGKLWIKNAPVLNEVANDDEDQGQNELVRKWIDEHITCELPERYANPELYELVTKFQVHKCTKSCRKLKKNKTGVYYGCRFAYPQTVMPKTKINSMEDVAKAKGHGYRLPMVQLMRQNHERMINPYNPCLLLLWEANMDIQFIGESSFVLNRYITGYMSKTEKNAAQEAFEGIDQSKSLYSRLLTFGIKAVRDRELGAYEAADNLLNNSIFFASRQIVFVGTAKKAERKRKLKSKRDIEGLTEESTEIFCNNMVDTYYPSRPDELEDMSLYTFAANYERLPEIRGKTEKALSKQQELKNGKGVIRKRTKTVIVKSTYFQLGSEEYYRAMLMLHKPWRDEDTLIAECSTYLEAFKAEVENLKTLADANHVRTKLERALEELKEIEARTARDAERVVNEEEEGQLWGEAAEQDQRTEMQATAQYTPFEIVRHLASLNSKQEEIVTLVEKKIDQQERHILEIVQEGTSRWHVHKKKCDCDDCDSIKMFVSGLAGTGKSHVIKGLQMSIDQYYGNEENDPAVLIAAPTGLAALNVNGTTIHKLLKLPVQHGGDPEYWPLEQTDIKQLRAVFRNLRLIIIDEISMVSNVVLHFIDHRLREIYQNDQLFGGVNLVVFGDLLQLKPVRSQFCYVPISTGKMKAVFSTTYTYNVWNHFEYRELTENMRQKDDLVFAEMLARIRVGSPQAEDVDELKKRILCKTDQGDIMLWGDMPEMDRGTECSIEDAANFYINNMHNKDERAMCLLSKNVLVDQFNDMVIQMLGIEAVVVRAQDVAGQGRSEKGTRKKRAQMAEGELEKASDTGGLATEIKIGVKCRVMLRRNVDLTRRLVNGSMGTVTAIRTGFHTDGRTPIIESAFVKFDGTEEPQKIDRVSANFVRGDGVSVRRKQIPLMPAYAVTVHKAQGLSLDNVMITIDKDCFEDNMAYVALSRCRNISGLYFIRFEPCWIHAFKDSWAEYNALRRKFTPSLGRLPAVNENPHAIRSMRAIRMEASSAFTDVVPMEPTMRTQKRVPYRQPLSSDEYILKLRNSPGENACYINAFIQPLMRLEPLFTIIPAGYSHVADELVRLRSQYQQNSAQVESVSDLRRYLDQARPDPYFGSQQQLDVTEVVYALFSGGQGESAPHLPTEARALFTFTTQEQGTCRGCGHITSVENPDSQILELASCPGDRDTSFRELLQLTNTWQQETMCLEACQRPTVHDVERKWIFGASQRYLMVLVPPFYADPATNIVRKRTAKIKGFSANKQAIAGAKFKTVAAVSYLSETGDAGHYVTLLRTGDDTWVTADDTRVVQPRRIFVPNLQNVMLLILEKTN